MRRGGLGGRSEDGTFMILYAFLIVTLLLMIAIVIDLGGVRSDRQLSRSTADSAAAAGASQLPASPIQACRDAWAYLRESLSADPSLTDPCSSPTAHVSGVTPSSFAACNPAAPGDYTKALPGGYMATITWPVPNTDVLMGDTSVPGGRSQTFDSVPDGTDPCSRLGVTISYSRSTFFGGIVGTKTISSKVHSVARYNPSFQGLDTPALVALNPSKCQSVFSQGHLTVHSAAGGDGVIVADSTCTAGSGGTISTQGSGTVDAGATGVLSYLGTSPSGNVTGVLKAAGTATTQSPLDAVYHCLHLATGCATGQTDAVQPCLDLSAATGVPAGGAACNNPGGTSYTKWPAAGQVCTDPSTIPATKYLYINCGNATTPWAPTGSVNLTGGGTIVLAGGLSLKSATLKINSTSSCAAITDFPTAVAGDTVLVLRGNSGLGLDSNGTLVMARTTVVTAASGLNMQSNPFLCWTAPATAVANQSLKGLLYWSDLPTSPQTCKQSNASSFQYMQGNPIIAAKGVFAAPHSGLCIGGTADIAMTHVQVWIDSVDLHNNSASLALQPDPFDAVPVTLGGAQLIR